MKQKPKFNLEEKDKINKALDPVLDMLVKKRKDMPSLLKRDLIRRMADAVGYPEIDAALFNYKQSELIKEKTKVTIETI